MLKRLALFYALLASAAVIAADVPAKPVAIKFPDNPAPKPAPQPPAPTEPEVVKLGKQQFYVIAATKPLVLLREGSGKVDLSVRKPPFMLPTSSVVGWQPAKDDPDFVHWDSTYPYLYVLKAAKTGPVRVTVVPAVNDVGTDGKQVPLTAADIVSRDLTVDDGDTPAPKPPTPEPTPFPGSTEPDYIWYAPEEANDRNGQLTASVAG